MPRKGESPRIARNSTRTTSCIRLRVTDNHQRFVYVVRSERRKLLYVGLSSNVARRLATHNSGGSVFTAAHRPWRLAASIELPTERQALEFERYLKSGSGRAFMNGLFR